MDWTQNIFQRVPGIVLGVSGAKSWFRENLDPVKLEVFYILNSSILYMLLQETLDCLFNSFEGLVCFKLWQMLDVMSRSIS